MTKLPGDRPERSRNFHGTKGEHLFPHPESYIPRSQWTAWDKRYATHLERHRELLKNPEPMPGDGEAVVSLFTHIAHLEQIIAKEKLLILALRERAAQAPDDMAEVDRRIRDTLRAGGVPAHDELEGSEG